MTNKSCHFIGIGGIGMSGIARYLCAQGENVSGSDARESATTNELTKMGCKVSIGHTADNVLNASEIIVSSAIRQDNPELLKARELGIPIVHRSKKLAELVNKAKGITIAGTHGKTSTSSMSAAMLESAGKHPSFVVGGIVNGFSNNAGHGKSEWFVIEADESDGSLVEYRPEIAVLTNVEMDHIDYFKSQEQLDNVFLTYINNIRPGGTFIYCVDDPGVNNLLTKISSTTVKMVSYGLDNNAKLQAKNLTFEALTSSFDVYLDGNILGNAKINVPGQHNVLNSLAVLAIGLETGLSFEEIVEGLKSYHGVQRRFQVIEKTNDFLVVDDYAHHPSEIRVTLAAARNAHKNRIISVFQPHRYSRTQSFWKEFGESFDNADEVIIAGIYPAGEDPIPEVSSQLIVDRLTQLRPASSVHQVNGIDEIQKFIVQKLQPNDLIITLGAGDIWKVSSGIAQHIKQTSEVADSK